MIYKVTKMVKYEGGNQQTILNAKHSCIILGECEREVIADQKGDKSISEFIRDSIMLRAKTKISEHNELKELKEKTLEQEKLITTFKKQEAKRIKVNEEQLAYIAQSYKDWESTSGLVDKSSRFYWAQACTKGMKISPEEALAYLQGEGVFSLNTP